MIILQSYKIGVLMIANKCKYIRIWVLPELSQPTEWNIAATGIKRLNVQVLKMLKIQVETNKETLTYFIMKGSCAEKELYKAKLVLLV